MVPSTECILIALLVAFAVAAPNLQLSAAIRVEGTAEATANSDQEEAEGSTAAAPSPDSDPFPPMLAQPKECRPLLMRLMPCASFLTNSSVYVSEGTCCDGFNYMFTLDRATCVCHVVNDDIAQLLPAPMHHMRMMELFSVCRPDSNVGMVQTMCKLLSVYVPPMDAPSPPPLAPSPAPYAGWP